MILCSANAIPLLFEQVEKKGDKHFNKFRQDQLLFLDFSITDLTSKDLNSRNRIVLIRTYNTCLLLKQPRKNSRADTLTLQKESLLTETFNTDQKLKSYVVKGFGFDEVNSVLFRQYADDVLPVSELILEDCEEKWKVHSSLGKMMSTFHQAMRWPYANLEAYEPLFESVYPSVLLALDLEKLPYYEIATTPEIRRYIHFLNPQNKAPLVTALSRLAKQWDANRHTLIHGDVRFENILSNDDGSSTLLIDWELSMKGDVAWDVSAILHYAVFTCYNFRRPASSFDAIRNNFAPFWHAYAANIEDQDVLKDLKQRIVAYCGLRICDRHIKSDRVNRGWDAQFLLDLGEKMIINDHIYSACFI